MSLRIQLLTLHQYAPFEEYSVPSIVILPTFAIIRPRACTEEEIVVVALWLCWPIAELRFDSADL
jgi:hypothetical protein